MAPPAAAVDSSLPDLRALTQRYGLDRAAVPRLAALLRLLVTDPLAPTAVRDLDKALNDHLADSLVALELGVVRRATTIADLGSGAGLPGLPLAIALPSAAVTLVESAARKCQFLERAVAACAAGNVTVVNARAEAWPEGFGGFELVTARALGPLTVVVEYAAPVLALGGTLVVWRGRRDSAEERAGELTAREVGLECVEVRRVIPYQSAMHRNLHLISKVRDTPARFPRRPGMALKRPLYGPDRSAGPTE